MKNVFRGLATAAAVIALSGAAFAGQAKPAKTAKTATKTAAAKTEKAPKATVITASGTISKYDAASNMLTVTTPKGDVSFTVDKTASVFVSGKKMMASDLSSHVGHKATVRYTESNGSKMASSVRVTGVPRTAAAAPAAKKPAAAKKS